MPKFRILDADGEVEAYLDAPDDQLAANVGLRPGSRSERLGDDVDLLSLPVRPPRPVVDDPEAAP
jgi:hypothetical protein